jgi:Xaa-Pro aminopeptidase
MTADPGHASHERAVALLLADDDQPHLFTAYPEGVPPELRADHVHPVVYVELEAGVDALVAQVRELCGGSLPGSLAVDDYTAALYFGLQRQLGGATKLLNAEPIVSAAKLCKTVDELECIRRAQRINELAMYDCQAALRPGMRQSDLTGIFLRRIFELGATGNILDPIWQVMPSRRADGPFTTNDAVAFPLPTTDRILREGDVIWIDSGLNYQGYASDFGRTWIVGDPPRPTRQQRTQYQRWQAVVDATLELVRPGTTGAQLTAAARAANDGVTPWLAHFFLIHGVGIESAEMPLIGTDLGEEFDATVVLAPGMVLVLEPVIWEEGHGGYRAEDIVAVTDDGFVRLSNYPYSPYD